MKDVSAALLMDDSSVLEGLEILQSMEPAGVGARDARECILLQIERSPDAPYIAYDVIQKFSRNSQRKMEENRFRNGC